jgi:predicted Fe-Mo cluster-binding NifX family protein
LKVAVTAEGADLSSKISHQFGIAPYMLVIDTETMDFNVMENPGASSQRGAGTRLVVFAVNKNVDAVLTGYCSPVARGHFESNGIRVITGISGTVKDAVEKYIAGGYGFEDSKEKKEQAVRLNRQNLTMALNSALKQFANIVPVLFGVVLLIGLFNTFVSEEVLASVFTGNTFLDTLWGACFGSIIEGNPINSYVIGAILLENGISLFAVTAFIVAWVTVGLIQLPAEIASLGLRFALLRNAFCFVLAIPVAILTVILVNLTSG